MSGPAIAYARGVIPSVDREKDDFYPTPASATLALLANEAFGPRIWEPACGDGAISRVLAGAGHDVVSSDLYDRGFGEPRIDFLMEWKLRAPEIVTNPPFKMAEQILRHGLSLGATKIAMLLRLAWLEGTERKRMFESTPISRSLCPSGSARVSPSTAVSARISAFSEGRRPKCCSMAGSAKTSGLAPL